MEIFFARERFEPNSSSLRFWTKQARLLASLPTAYHGIHPRLLPATPPDDVAAIDELGKTYQAFREELGKIIIGQEQVIEQLAICLFARGHALLMGVPGLAKTLLVSSVAQTFDLSFNRIQFTPDLMPADITGTDIMKESGVGRV
jgi:MoxR-like ATPase